MHAQEPRRERFQVSAGGRRLQAERLIPAAAGEAPALVFLHEGLGSISQWKDVPAALSRMTGCQALVYDRWGFGGSEALVLPRPRDYLEIEATEALPEVLAACGIDRPILIGHSDGGSIALLYAAAFPEKVTACVTEAAHVFVEEVTLAGIREAAELWRTTDLKARLAKYHGANTENVFRGWVETWLRPDFRDWNIVGRLASIACPLLVIQGEDDEYGTAAQVDAIVAGSSGPATPLIIPGCAHIPHHQARESVLDAIARFLATLLTISA